MGKYRRAYTETDVSAAVDKVRRKLMGARAAARQFGVPPSTIRSRTQMIPRAVIRSGPQSILTTEEEAEIKKWIFDMQRRGFPVTKDMLAGTIQQILTVKPKTNPFKENRPGKKWFKLFRQRHPDIAIRTPEFITNASSKVSPEDVKGWFSTIHNYLEEQDLLEILQDPDRSVNGDETNFLLNPKTKAVLAMRGSQNVYDIERNNSKLAVTVMFSFYASGESVPPTIIYPYKSIPHAVAQSVPSSWGIAKSDSGWMNSEVFRDYIRNVLNPDLEKRAVKKPVLYFVDGHSSHINLETSKMCRELGIILVALYPNATRIMQPADVSCFKPLKNGWPKAVAKLRSSDANAKVTLQNFAPVLQDCLRLSLTRRTIKRGFCASGLFPWNFDAIDLTKFTAKSASSEGTGEIVEDRNETEDSQALELVKAKRVLQRCVSVIGPARMNKFKGEFVCLDSEEEQSLFEIFQVLNENFPEIIEESDALGLNMPAGKASDTDEQKSQEEQEALGTDQKPHEPELANINDSGVADISLKEILSTPPTPKRKGTREYKSKKYSVLTSDEFIEEYTMKDQEKKRLEEEKENRKKAREQKKIENDMKKQMQAEKKACRNKKKVLSDKN